jgi:hypothetical protein
VRGRTNRALLQRRHALVWMPSEESAGRQERRTGARWIVYAYAMESYSAPTVSAATVRMQQHYVRTVAVAVGM